MEHFGFKKNKTFEIKFKIYYSIYIFKINQIFIVIRKINPKFNENIIELKMYLYLKMLFKQHISASKLYLVPK
jgi:hypothetical protein